MYLFIVTEANCKETLVQAFSCEFSEISKNTFSTEHLQTTASVAICFYTFLYTSRGRSIRLQMFFKIDVFENIANFTGEHPCWSLFLQLY